MKIDVRVCEGCGGAEVLVGEVPIMHTSSRGIAERYARVLSGARDLGHRAGVRCLMHEIGYTEDEALQVWSYLAGRTHHNPSRSVH